MLIIIIIVRIMIIIMMMMMIIIKSASYYMAITTHQPSCQGTEETLVPSASRRADDKRDNHDE